MDQYLDTKQDLLLRGFIRHMVLTIVKLFSPVIKSSTIRIVLSLAVMNGWLIRQVDVNNAFLNDILAEDVYMEQSEGFVDPSMD